MTPLLSHQAIVEHLYTLTESKHYLLAYSGGLDSSVLLHLMHRASHEDSQIRLAAIHINHGLSPRASEWSEYCRHKCEAKDVPYQSVTVNLGCCKGESIEAAARQSRYAILNDRLQYQQVLLTAHHQDDQCETLLLQMLRGSGLSGIASMPEIRDFSNGFLARPLLSYDRESIRQYALKEGIDWIDDESNSDTDRDRNYLRHNIVPLIKDRWPSATRTIARTAKHSAECIDLVNTLGEQDLARSRIIGTNVVSSSSVKQFSISRQRTLLRCWIREHERLTPPANILERILSELLESATDRNPVIKWDYTEVRRYRDCLYIMDPLPAIDNQTSLKLEEACNALPLGRLKYQPTVGVGINRKLLEDRFISIRFRSGGESIIPYYSSYSHEAKKLMSEHGIPSWLRDLMPLVYVNDELVAIPGICVNRRWSALPDQDSINLVWHLPESLEAQHLPYTKQ